MIHVVVDNAGRKVASLVVVDPKIGFIQLPWSRGMREKKGENASIVALYLCEPWSALHDVGLPVVVIVPTLLVFLVASSAVPRWDDTDLADHICPNSVLIACRAENMHKKPHQPSRLATV